MYGNLANNTQFIRLVRDGYLQIYPRFEAEKLQLAHYPLSIGAVITPEMPTPRVVLSPYAPDRLDIGSRSFVVPARTYRIVIAQERIALAPGLVGHFIPASNVIELGLMLTMGKLEHPFGTNREYIRFGLYNATDADVQLRAGDRIAYLALFDLTGTDHAAVSLTQRDRELYSRRQIGDDGEVNYDEGVEE